MMMSLPCDQLTGTPIDRRMDSADPPSFNDMSSRFATVSERKIRIDIHMDMSISWSIGRLID